MNRTEKLSELRSLQARCDAIRQELGIHPPGQISYWAPLGVTTEKSVVIESDGFGGATTILVEGNYPLDYIIHSEKSFLTDDEAEACAEALAYGSSSPSQILGTPARSII